MIIEKNTPSAQLETCYEAPAQIVLSVIVIKCSYTCGDWDQHPYQQILLGFFSPCLSHKVTSSSFGEVYSCDQQKRNQMFLNKKNATMEAALNFHQFWDVRGLSHGPRAGWGDAVVWPWWAPGKETSSAVCGPEKAQCKNRHLSWAV